MRVFISVDMEGISGLVRWADVASTGIDFALNRSLMTADCNAAIAGAFEGGATEVVVEENHGVEDLCVLRTDELDPRCRVIRGAGRPGATTMAGLDETTDLIMLVGHHARGGSFPGIMAHTISYGGFKRVLLFGEPIGEADFFALRGAELNIPIGFVSGDQVVIEQVQALSPDVIGVEVKIALANQAANCIPPARARTLIQAGAKSAVVARRAQKLQPSPSITALADPSVVLEFEVELRKPASEGMQQNVDALDGFMLLDEQRVGVTASTAELAFRRVAYLGYADRAGLTKH